MHSGNEKYVGQGLAASHIPRSSIWITSKLWNDAHRPADVKPALEKTLSDLGVDYLDLYLMHWPVAFDPTKKGSVVDKKTSILDTWFAMEQLVRAGLTKNIGISNFAKHQVETILKHCRICPAAHEFETHPYLQQSQFVTWHREQGIQVIAYSPFANLNPIYDSKMPSILEDPFFTSLAAAKNVTIPQLVLAWGMQRETVVIPKSVHKERILENFGALNVQLEETEMELIALQDRKARFNNPSKSWGVDLFDDLDGA
jgi:alcohol dehydrogenase (NADP+)